jgi:hypothetical protein
MPRFVYTKPELILYEKLKKEKINFSTQIPILIKKYKKYVYVDFLIEKNLWLRLMESNIENLK